MSDRLIYADGTLRPGDASASIREADLLATREGLFETLLVADGVIRDASAHVDRLMAAARGLDLAMEESRALLLEVSSTVAASTRTPWARLRITAVAGDGDVELLVSVVPYSPPSPTAYARGVEVRLATSSHVRREDKSRQVKSLAWRREGEVLLEAASGVYDVLLLNDAGRLAEGTRTNVVVRHGGVTVTPPLGEGCLPGTVRARLLRSGMVREGELGVAEVLSGAEMVLTNSLVGVLPVSRIDDVNCELLGLADELRAALKEVEP